MRNGPHRSLVDIARQRAAGLPDKVAYTNLKDNGEEQRSITYGELDTACRRIGAALQERDAGGERVLLLLPQGVEFVVGFFGTLYGGGIAVPAHTPKPNKRSWATFEAIVANCRPRLILTCRAIRDKIVQWSASFPEISALEMLCIEDLEAEMDPGRWNDISIEGSDVAFLQYTSGSTSAPKGVVVTHENLIHNADLTARHMGHDEETVIVSWLPLFHDLGLIGIVIQTLHVGASCYMMGPAAFSGNPALWLQAISRYRATTSMSSDFGYRLCVKSIRPEQMTGVDLSSWRNALNAAEPVYASTLRSFQERFEPYGFAKDAFFPAYGLAEATLLSTTSRVGEPPVIVRVDKAALARGAFVPSEGPADETVELVSSGRPADDMGVAIVDPDELTPCEDGRIGEVWVRGASIARGYWQAPEASAETFLRSPRGADQPHYLRTGDLGFLHEGELFVAGRLKDLIIARGRNIYPQDIELTVKDCDPAFRTVNGAAFSIAADDGESTVIVHEIERTARNTTDFAKLEARVREAVWQQHEIRLADVVFILPASLPKTTSGKVQRRLTKSLYLSGELAPLTSKPKPAPARASEPGDIAAHIVQRLRELAGEPTADAGPDAGFGALGLDSVVAAQLVTALNTELGLALEPTVFWQFPTPMRLARHIAGRGPDAAPESAGAGETVAPEAAARRERPSSRDIAIVGISCRLPGAATKDAFWANQRAGRNCIGDVPRTRWDAEALHGDPHRDAGRTDVGRGGFIDGEDMFAPEFFGLSSYEAGLMDPQHRLFLKATWEAIWDAGHDPSSLAGRPVGVFAGVQFQDYQKLVSERGGLSAQLCTGNAHAMLANRASYLLDLHGPSEVIDTACSSSLVAIHRAVTALRQGECELAVAGGVNLLLVPDFFIMGRQMGVLSPTGQCRTFDAGADGYVRAEGVGALVLKPYDAAIRDRDDIRAVIRGSAVNHGGKAASLTAPNSLAQADLMVRALSDAGLSPDDVSYVEMHGTGTELGDPIEVESIKTAFRRMRAGAVASPCALGSAKANIGHLEPAAGVAGVINAVMAIRNECLPALSTFRSLNPHIKLDDGLFVQAKAGAWPPRRDGAPRTAMVNSFGFGGANACVVLGEHVHDEADRDGNRAAGGDVEIPVAGSSDHLLKRHAAGLADAVDALGAKERSDGAAVLRDVAFTLQGRNENREARVVVRAAGIAELSNALRAVAAQGTEVDEPGVFTAARPGPDGAVGLGQAARRWLREGTAAWPDLAGARRRSLPTSAWPDRSCWFEPREPDVQPGATDVRTSFLLPAWRPEPLGPPRDVSALCIWVVGRSDEQAASFETALRRRVPARTTIVTSNLADGAAEPSLEIWNLAGDEPDIAIVLPDPHATPEIGDDRETKVVFDLARDLIDRAYGRHVDVFHVSPLDGGPVPGAEALSALAKSAFLECDWLRIHTLQLAARTVDDLADVLAGEILAAPPAAPRTIRHAPAREVLELCPTAWPEKPGGEPAVWFRDGGVYLVAGGAGELGQRLVDRLLGEVDASFVLAGRSPLDGALKTRVEALYENARQPSRISYVECDIADRNQARALVGDVRRRHGRLDGILNLVTAHEDGFLFRKSWSQFARVSAAKVRGSINLDLAAAEVELDFFVSFSSLAALGLAGGSDYAFGCAFQNAFARWRDEQVALGRRHGASRSISWSRWQWDKYVTRDFDEWFASLGFTFFDAATGIDAFRAAMNLGEPVTFALQGRPDRILRSIDLSAGLLRSQPARPDDVLARREPVAAIRISRPAPPPIATAAATVGAPSGSPHELERTLCSVVAELLKLDAVDPDAPFAGIGLDSVLAIRLIVLIEQRLGVRLTPKAILGNASVAKLADHLLSMQAANGAAEMPAQTGLDAIATEMASRLKELLRADEIARDARFVNIGVDSIIAMKLAADFRQRFGVGISPRWFIDYPTIDRMAREIETRRPAHG